MRCSLLVIAFVGLVVAAVVENANSSPTSPQGSPSKKSSADHSPDQKSVTHQTAKNSSPTKISEGHQGMAHVSTNSETKSLPLSTKADVSPPADTLNVSGGSHASPAHVASRPVNPNAASIKKEKQELIREFDELQQKIDKLQKRKRPQQYSEEERKKRLRKYCFGADSDDDSSNSELQNSSDQEMGTKKLTKIEEIVQKFDEGKKRIKGKGSRKFTEDEWGKIEEMFEKKLHIPRREPKQYSNVEWEKIEEFLAFILHTKRSEIYKWKKMLHNKVLSDKILAKISKDKLMIDKWRKKLCEDVQSAGSDDDEDDKTEDQMHSDEGDDKMMNDRQSSDKLNLSKEREEPFEMLTEDLKKLLLEE